MDSSKSMCSWNISKRETRTTDISIVTIRVEEELCYMTLETMVTYLSTLHWKLDGLSGVHHDVVLETVSLKGNYYFKRPLFERSPYFGRLWGQKNSYYKASLSALCTVLVHASPRQKGRSISSSVDTFEEAPVMFLLVAYHSLCWYENSKAAYTSVRVQVLSF